MSILRDNRAGVVAELTLLSVFGRPSHGAMQRGHPAVAAASRSIPAETRTFRVQRMHLVTARGSARGHSCPQQDRKGNALWPAPMPFDSSNVAADRNVRAPVLVLIRPCATQQPIPDIPRSCYNPVKLRSPDIHRTWNVRNLRARQALSKVFPCR
jgi:hypothetical protein